MDQYEVINKIIQSDFENADKFIDETMWFVYSDNVYAKTKSKMYAFDGTKMES